MDESGKSRDAAEMRVLGVPDIAGILGVSDTTARKLVHAARDGIPVERGRYGWQASQGELEAWRDAKGGHLADRVVGCPAIAALVGVSVQTLRKYLRDPKSGFPANFVGGRWWASRSAVIAWCERQTGGIE